MTPARRMKYEMTLKERAARRGRAQSFEETLAELPPGDQAEVERFRSFLADQGMPLPELIQKHGAAYLGFTPEEVAAIERAAAEARPYPGASA